MTVHDAVDTEIVKPLGLDGMSIGAPPEQRGRVAELIVRFGDAERAERFASARRATHADCGRRSTRSWFRAPTGLFASTEVLDAAIPAVNGCFTARSLARMYAALAGGGVLDGERFLSVDTLRRATEIQSTGRDIVVGFPMRWRLGYHLAATHARHHPERFRALRLRRIRRVGRSRQRSRRRIRLQPGRRNAVRRHPLVAHRRPRPHGGNHTLTRDRLIAGIPIHPASFVRECLRPPSAAPASVTHVATCATTARRVAGDHDLVL